MVQERAGDGKGGTSRGVFGEGAAGGAGWGDVGEAGRVRREGGSYGAIYRVVRRIPAGRVATYGQVAGLAGVPGQARLVGYAMHAAAEGDRVPWHRVVNARGRISARSEGPGGSVVQRLRLEREGVTFDAGGRLSLERYRWAPRAGRSGSGAR